MHKPRFFTLVAMIFSAAAVRLLPHPWNFTPVAAMALFAGAQFENKLVAFAVPLLAVFASDLFLGFYPNFWIVYVAHIAVVFIGFGLRQRQPMGRVAAASVFSSVTFFLISNLAFFFTSGQFSMTISGLMQCYTVAIPFFRNTIAGDLFFSLALFGAIHLAERRYPVLRSSLVTP